MFKGKRFTPAMIVAMIALAVALSGTAVAGTAKLITGSQIANGTIKLTHLNKSTKAALKGDRGSTGAQGAVGAQGLPRAGRAAGRHAARRATPASRATRARRRQGRRHRRRHGTDRLHQRVPTTTRRTARRRPSPPWRCDDDPACQRPKLVAIWPVACSVLNVGLDAGDVERLRRPRRVITDSFPGRMDWDTNARPRLQPAGRLVIG